MIDCEKLTGFVKEVMMSAGLPEETADVFADALVFADMRGVGSHGVTRLAIYHTCREDSRFCKR